MKTSKIEFVNENATHPPIKIGSIVQNAKGEKFKYGADGRWKKMKKQSEPFPPQTDEQVLSYALYQFQTQYEKKFRAGMVKYKTPIWNKSGINEAFPEVWDLLSYLTLAKLQMARMHRLLEALGDECPAVLKNPHFKQLMELAGEKPLVVAAPGRGTTECGAAPGGGEWKRTSKAR